MKYVEYDVHLYLSSDLIILYFVPYIWIFIWWFKFYHLNNVFDIVLEDV